MKKFTEIDRFRTTVSHVSRYVHDRGLPLPTYDYTGTVKLHGTNGGIHRTLSGELRPQSRSRILDISCDNYGFAKFVCANKQNIHDLCSTYFPSNDVILYGEWCGTGIQSNVAIAQVEPHFVMFGVRVDGDYQKLNADIHDNNVGIYNILQIPAYHITIDFSNPTEVIHHINQLTNEVEDECPWGKFRGVSGIGEGIVWIPDDFINITDLWFKTKGGKHSGHDRVKGIKAKISVEKANSISQCLDIVLPEWKLQQGIKYLKENFFDIDTRAINEYLKWVCKDVLKEDIDTIVDNGLDWKEMHKAVNNRARQYILGVINGEIDEN